MKKRYDRQVMDHYRYDLGELYEPATAIYGDQNKDMTRGAGVLKNGMAYCVILTIQKLNHKVVKLTAKFTNEDTHTVFCDSIDVTIPRKRFYKLSRLSHSFESHGIHFPEMFMTLAPLGSESLAFLVGPKVITWENNSEAKNEEDNKVG